jgi:ABC-type branched-subunit amino acid transport system substrate-binding protein
MERRTNADEGDGLMKLNCNSFRHARTLLAGAVAFIIAPLLGGTDLAHSADQLHIAMNMPLTGPIAEAIIPFRDAFLMGLDDGAKEFNVPRDALVTDIEDNAGEPKQAVTIMQKQFLNPVDVYVSSASAETAAIVKEVDAKKIPHFMFAFEAFLTRGFTDRLRINPHFKISGPLYVKWAMARHAKRVALVYLNYAAFHEMYGEIVIPEMKKSGMEVTTQSFDMGTKDYSTLALKVADFKPDVIILDGFAFHLRPLIEALRTLDLIHNGNTMAGIDFVEMLHDKTTPVAETKGIAFVTPDTGLPEGMKRVADWNKRFQDAFKLDPGTYGAYGYDTARVLVAAYAKEHKVTTDTIRAVLPFDGLVGKINLDKDGDIEDTMGIGVVNDAGGVEDFK